MGAGTSEGRTPSAHGVIRGAMRNGGYRRALCRRAVLREVPGKAVGSAPQGPGRSHSKRHGTRAVWAEPSRGQRNALERVKENRGASVRSAG